MTVIVKIGRRVPRNFLRRTASKMKGLMTFQENIWLIIERSMTIAKKKASKSPTNIIFDKRNYREMEDLNYDLEWIEITIKGNPEEEEEEYTEAMELYKSLGQLFKNEMPKDNDLAKPFLTNKLTKDQIEKAYKAGYTSTKYQTIAQRLLDMGILTYVDRIHD